MVADELETEKDENDRLKAEINELKTRPQAVSSMTSFGSNDEKQMSIYALKNVYKLTDELVLSTVRQARP